MKPGMMMRFAASTTAALSPETAMLGRTSRIFPFSTSTSAWAKSPTCRSRLSTTPPLSRIRFWACRRANSGSPLWAATGAGSIGAAAASAPPAARKPRRVVALVPELSSQHAHWQRWSGLLRVDPLMILPSQKRFCSASAPSPREWIRAELEFHHLRQRAPAALGVERRAVAVRRPQSPPLPAGIGVVDAPIEALGKEPHRIGPGQRIERPALRPVPACSSRAIEHLAFAPVEGTHVAAGERHPDDAVAIDVHAARRVARHRRLVDFGQRRSRRVITEVDARNRSRKAEHRSPDRAVDRAYGDAVDAHRHALILRWIDRLLGIDIVVALAVAVRVEHERRQSLRLLLVAGLVEHRGVEPAEHLVAGSAGAQIERVAGVLAEVEMMGLRAGVDQRELLALRIVHRQLTAGLFDRKCFRGRMIRSLAAERRRVRRPDSRREPHPTLVVVHGIVRAGLAVPDRLVAPVGRGTH